MNYLPIINVKRIAFGFGLFFGLLTGAHSQESVHRPDLSGQPMLLYFRLGKALVDNGYMTMPVPSAIWMKCFPIVA